VSLGRKRRPGNVIATGRRRVARAGSGRWCSTAAAAARNSTAQEQANQGAVQPVEMKRGPCIGLLPVDGSEVDTNFPVEDVVHHPSVSKGPISIGFGSFRHGLQWPFDDQRRADASERPHSLRQATLRPITFSADSA
jgi:hypothetical protein